MANGASDWINQTLAKKRGPEARWLRGTENIKPPEPTRLPTGTTSASNLIGTSQVPPPPEPVKVPGQDFSDEHMQAFIAASEAGKHDLTQSSFFGPQGRRLDEPTDVPWWRASRETGRGVLGLQDLDTQGFDATNYTAQDLMKLAELGASDHPHADIAGAAINYLTRETKEVRREELADTNNKLQAQYNALSGYGLPIPKELSDALLANSASQLALDADKEPTSPAGGDDDPGAITYFGGSLLNPENLNFTDTPSTPAETMAVGAKGLGFLMSNDINIGTNADGSLALSKTVNGIEQDLQGEDHLKAFDAWNKYQTGLELSSFQAKETITQQLGGDRAIRFEKFKNDFTTKRDELNNRFTARQNDLTRAIDSGNLEESIRAHRATEDLTRERNRMDKQQFAMTMMLQIASNPATLFFLRKSGFVNQLATFMGIDPAVFAGPAEGSENSLSAFNMQSWNQLTPQQQRISMYSMQAETGLSEAEIKQRIQETSPGGFAQMTRRTLG